MNVGNCLTVAFAGDEYWSHNRSINCYPGCKKKHLEHTGTLRGRIIMGNEVD